MGKEERGGNTARQLELTSDNICCKTPENSVRGCERVRRWGPGRVCVSVRWVDRVPGQRQGAAFKIVEKGRARSGAANEAKGGYRKKTVPRLGRKLTGRTKACCEEQRLERKTLGPEGQQARLKPGSIFVLGTRGHDTRNSPKMASWSEA